MRKIIDGKGRLLGRVSIIDVFVIVIALCFAAAVYLSFQEEETPLTTTDTFEITYTVFVPAVRMPAAALLRPGDNLYSMETATFIGIITEVETSPAVTPEPLLDGTVILGNVEGRLDVVLTVDTQGSIIGGRHFAGRTIELNVNALYRLFTKYNDFNGYIHTIDVG
jgi:hypothetical protein